MKFKIELEIDDDKKIVTVTDSRADSIPKQFKGGVHLVAADGDKNIYYVLSYGAAADIGWALAQAINDGWKLPFVQRMFYNFTEWINKFLVNEGDGYNMADDEDLEELDEIANEWEDNDKKKPVIN